MRQPESILNLSGDSWLSHKHYPQHYALYPVLISCVDIHNHVHLHLVPDRDHYNIKKKKKNIWARGHIPKLQLLYTLFFLHCFFLQSCSSHGSSAKDGSAAPGTSTAAPPILSRALSKGKRFRWKCDILLFHPGSHIFLPPPEPPCPDTRGSRVRNAIIPQYGGV